MKSKKVLLNQVCEIENGFAFKGTDFKDRGTPLLRISNIANQKVSFDKGAVFLDEDCLVKHKRFVVHKGDVVIALSGATTGKYGVYTLDYPCLLNQRIGLIRNDQSSSLSSKYFYFYLNILKSEILRKAQGAAQPNISTKDIGRFEIPLPPLEEQQKIAEILDAADDLRQKDQQLIDHYTALSKSLFLDMFGDPVVNSMGWPIQSFDYFAVIDTNMTKDFDYYADFPHIGVANIEKTTGALVNYRSVRDEDLSSGKYIFTSEHIIYSKIRPILNKVALPEFSGLASADSYPILVKQGTSNKTFFAYILRSKLFLDFISQHSNRTNIPKANKAQLRQFKSIAPPLELQNQFADRIALIDKQKQQAEVSKAQSNNLFNCLLQKAFTGELTNKELSS